jgi:hypothetical protein
MIESCYWKEELRRISKLVRPVTKPRRWTERAHCIVERDLMIGFFIIRRMIELHKVSPKTKNFNMEVYSFRNRGKKVTILNRGDLDTLYDLDNERREIKQPFYMSNQFIHAYLSFISRNEKRNWDSVFIVSDFDRNDCIWRVPIECIRDLFDVASRDYVHSGSYTYNERKGDYDVVTQ